MAVSKHIEDVFGKDKTLYDIIGVQRNATNSDIRKAYFRQARCCMYNDEPLTVVSMQHPDKNPGNQDAHTQFQALSMVHAILSSEEKRKLYDDTGDIDGDDEIDEENFQMWYDYYRTLFPKVTTNDIDSFRATYQGSEEERQDVLKVYKNNDGDMGKVVNEVMLAEDDDMDRFLAMIEKAINDGEVEMKSQHSKRKRKTAASQRKAKKEAAAAEEVSAALKARAQHRTIVKKNRENDFNALLSKYSEGKHKDCDPPPINDADFEAARSRLEHTRCKAKAAPK